MFSEARISHDANFNFTQFSGTADFTRSRFGGTTLFVGTKFNGSGQFGMAQLNGPTRFVNAEFTGVAHFSAVTAREYLLFQGTTFLDAEESLVVDFSYLTSDTAQRIRFEGTSLSRASFLRTDVSQVRFVGCKWARKSVPLIWPIPVPWPYQNRTVIHDENILDVPDKRYEPEERLRLVADTYRQLRLNYESNRQEAEAGDFYIGQMEMRRRDKASYTWLYRSLLGVYRVLAMYGESYQRPVCFYFTLGLLFALFYLWGGFQVGEAQVKYSLGFDFANAGKFFQDYVRAYVQALTAGGIGLLGGQFAANLEGAAWWVAPVRYFNMLLDTFLVGFFVVALRRHFRRRLSSLPWWEGARGRGHSPSPQPSPIKGEGVSSLL